MKKSILITLLLFLGVNGFGQKDSSNMITSDNPLRTSGYIQLGGTLMYDTTILISLKKDTVKTLLFCIDTTFLKDTEFCIVRSYGNPDSAFNICHKNRVPYVFWLFGYVVYEKRLAQPNTVYLSYTIENQFEKVNIGYLGEDKKPLKKTTVVFLSINR